ncbi:GTPase domain-containing protein [Demequina gelatinilytica]|uniref:GTPase domain-containing protein n=1 Tax=Demequina gelatinilytica TaxID=1638980 RepID=UPI0012E03257|nr:GTPase domain-containing protein [Demequina gelatinilytica]
MPLPLIIGGAVVVAAAAGAVGTGLSMRHLKGKSVLIVGPSGSGKTSLVRIFGDNELVVRPSSKERWVNRASKLVDLQLKVASTDTPGGRDGVDAIRERAAQADLICLVVSAQALHASDGWENPVRIAKLVGTLAGANTQCGIVLSHADSLASEELADVVKSPELLRLLDLTGASIVRPCDLTDRDTWSETTEALLGLLQRQRRSRKDRS